MAVLEVRYRGVRCIEFTSEYIVEKYFVVYVRSNTRPTKRGTPEKLPT